MREGPSGTGGANPARPALTLVLPGVPPSLNAWRGHPQRVARWHKAWRERTRAAADLARQNGAWDGQPWDPAWIVIRYCFADRRRRDADNFPPKGILDGLRAAGVIVDDDFAHVAWAIEAGPVARPAVTVVQIGSGEGRTPAFGSRLAPADGEV
jgi:Holliday junction resolvase RusA-like endonuclease